MHSVKETIEAFDKANGGDPVRVDDFLYFKNGARREVNPYGALLDPPSDEFKRLKVVEAYWETRLNKAINEFANAKQEYISAARSGAQSGERPPCSPKTAEEHLTKLSQQARQLQKMLNQTRDQILATPQGQARVQRDKDRAEATAANESFICHVGRINI